MKTLKKQNAILKTAACVALSTFYFAMLAYPFGVTQEGYAIERVLIAGLIFMAISIPAWIVNIKREFFTEEEVVEKKVTQKVTDIGQIAVLNKWLVPEEVEQILHCQEYDKKSFGEVAVKRNFLTMTQVKALLKLQRAHTPALQPYNS